MRQHFFDNVKIVGLFPSPKTDTLFRSDIVRTHGYFLKQTIILITVYIVRWFFIYFFLAFENCFILVLKLLNVKLGIFRQLLAPSFVLFLRV